MSLIAGIDVGVGGAIAITNECNDVWYLHKMPIMQTDVGNELDYVALYNVLNGVDHIYMERIQAIPISSKKSLFKFGGQYYAIRCMILLLKKSVEFIAPQTWKKVMMKDMSRKKKVKRKGKVVEVKDKSASVVKVKQLYPTFKAICDLKSSDDGKADAILIAEYGRRLLYGGLNKSEHL